MNKRRHIRILINEIKKTVKEKLRRAHGGCLGVLWRRRTWKAAKSRDESQADRDSRMSEWGNPSGEILTPEREQNPVN